MEAVAAITFNDDELIGSFNNKCHLDANFNLIGSQPGLSQRVDLVNIGQKKETSGSASSARATDPAWTLSCTPFLCTYKVDKRLDVPQSVLQFYYHTL